MSDASLFTLEFPPGTRVGDMIKGEQYTVGKDGKRREKKMPVATKKSDEPTPANPHLEFTRPASSWYGAAVLIGVAAVVLLAVIWLRR